MATKKALGLTILFLFYSFQLQAQLWDFEAEYDVIEWQFGNDIELLRSTDIAYTGSFSLKIVTDNEDSEPMFSNTEDAFNRGVFNELQAGDSVFMKLWIDQENISKIESLITAHEDFGPEASYFTIPADSLIAGEWQNIVIPISPDVPSNYSIGFFLEKKQETSIIELYIDRIEFSTYESPEVSLTEKVRGLNLDSLDTDFMALSWDTLNPNSFSKYTLHRKNLDNSVTVFDNLQDPFFIDNSISDSQLYKYWITATDVNNVEYEASDTLFVNSKNFGPSVTWDFETGIEGWRSFNDEESEISNEQSYSGLNSLRIYTLPNNQIGVSSVQIDSLIPNQVVYFHFFNPGINSNIISYSIATFSDDPLVFTEYSLDKFEFNSWNRIGYVVPDLNNITEFAFNIISKNQGAEPVYLDLVTTNPIFDLKPKLEIPRDLSIMNTDAGFELSWEISAGPDTVEYYNIYVRATDSDNEFTLIGKSTTNSFIDNSLESGEYEFAVSVVNTKNQESLLSESIVFGIIQVSVDEFITEIKEFKLGQNYPNPFNPSTNIQFEIPAFSFVTLKVYDITGREVKTLISEEKMPGIYIVNFNANTLSSGMYFYKLTADNFTKTQKMTLIK